MDWSLDEPIYDAWAALYVLPESGRWIGGLKLCVRERGRERERGEERERDGRERRVRHHQHKLQVCENNWIRRIAAGVRRVDTRRMKWAEHVVRLKDYYRKDPSQISTVHGCRKRERPQLRWEDSVKRDLRKTEEEEEKRPTTGTKGI